MIDLRIRGATIIDGTGAPRFLGDVEVDAARITAVGEQTSESARRTVEADGLVVSPGFFDLHTHYDAQWFWDSAASPSCWHGITSVLKIRHWLQLIHCAPSVRYAASHLR